MQRTDAPPRTKPQAERRDEIMTAAERLFLANGVEPTSVEEIARSAGIAKGSFYLHFAAKADVVSALRDRFVRQLLERIATAVARQPAEDGPARLATWAKACATGYLEAERLHHLVFVAAPPPTRDGLTQNPLIDHLAELLQAGIASGSWTIDDPRFTAVFLFNALHGVVNEPGAGGPHRNRLLVSISSHFLRMAGPKP